MLGTDPRCWVCWFWFDKLSALCDTMDMPERSSNDNKKRPSPKDINLLASRIVGDATEEELEAPETSTPEKNPSAVELGRLGGKKGGPARAAKLTPEQRSQIAKKAATARWKVEPEN